MQLIKLTESDRLQYTNFVSSRNGSFLQSWDWGEWQRQQGKIPHRFFVQADNNILLAAQVLEQTVSHFGWKYLYIPYGPVVMKHETWNIEQIQKTFLDGLQSQFPKTIFIRLEPVDPLHPIPYTLSPTKHIQPGKTLVVDLAKTENEMLQAMHPKTRYNIKVAHKHGVSIAVKDELSDIDAELIINTAIRQDYKSQPGHYFIDLVKFLKQSSSCHASVYEAWYENSLLTCVIMIDSGGTRTYLFGGTSPEHKNVMAAYALHWQAIKQAKSIEMKYYDFWGIETAKGETPGFVRFKLGFGGNQVKYPSAIDLIHHSLKYQIYKLARMLI